MLSASFNFEAASTFRSAPLFETLQAYTFQVSPNPAYLQEGLNTTLSVTVNAANSTTYYFKLNVTAPDGVSYATNISVTTNAVGLGGNSTRFWGNFSGAHTNLVGVYNVQLKNATTDQTLHSASFTVGLTNKLQYRRNEDVQIRASGYSVGENVTVDIRANASVVGYPKNATASAGGVVADTWRVPVDAELRNYTVIIANASTTVKPIPDTQEVTVFGATSYDVTVQPSRIQEGMNTTITVTIRDAPINMNYSFVVSVKHPRGNVYNASLIVTSNATGFGSSSRLFWRDFAGANTNYVGNYSVTVNQTLATTEFTVGLTDKAVYRRLETVLVQAAGYRPRELVRANLTYGAIPVGGFPVVFEANNGGIVTFSWPIPLNATPGTYTLIMANATSPGTVKIPEDRQNFEVLGIICSIQTRNLANEPVEGILVEVYKATAPNASLTSANSNASGWIIFSLDAGNYTFKALWKQVEVDVLLNRSLAQDTTLYFSLNLTNVLVKVQDDAGGGLSLIDLLFSYNYTTRGNVTRSESLSSTTNVSGFVEVSNLFTNISYVLRASRYGFALPNSPINNKTLREPLNTVIILVPRYTAFVRVFDSEAAAVSGVRVAAYEWTSGITEPAQTQTTNGGNATFSLTFGKYRLRAFDDSLLLNETTLDLIQDNLNLTFHLAVYNVDVTVLVRDYLGQPIPNANVTIERRIGSEYVLAYSQLTSQDGSALFDSIVGGDCRISVYVAGRLSAVESQFLGVNSSPVAFGVGEYIIILGTPIQAGLFAFVAFFIILAVVIVVLARKPLIRAFRRKR